MRINSPHVFLDNLGKCGYCIFPEENKVIHKTVEELQKWPYAWIKTKRTVVNDKQASTVGYSTFSRLCRFCSCIMMNEEVFQGFCEACAFRLKETDWVWIDFENKSTVA